jgi:hypothetical protein
MHWLKIGNIFLIRIESRFMSFKTNKTFWNSAISVIKPESFTLYSLNDIEPIKEEDSVILRARDDLAREIRKKEEEAKMKLQNEKEFEIQMKLERSRPKELVNGLKVTFDCNGQLIPIKQYNLDKFPNDFLQNQYKQLM